MFGMGKGFRQKKKLNRKQQEKEDSIKKFIEKYKVLCDEEGYQLDAVVEVTPQGVVPKITIIEHKPAPEAETKDWEECKKENAEIRKQEEAKNKEQK